MLYEVITSSPTIFVNFFEIGLSLALNEQGEQTIGNLMTDHLATLKKNNWGLLGHEWAVDMLKQHISRDALRHAHLFTGPPGLGRRTSYNFV